MTTKAEMFGAQYHLMDHLIPNEVLVLEWQALRKALAMAKLRGNRVEEMRASAPGFAISLIKEVLILRAFSTAVEAAMKAGDPAGLEKAWKTLDEAYRDFGKMPHPEIDGVGDAKPEEVKDVDLAERAAKAGIVLLGTKE